jgi:hypothetical protein
MGLVYGCTCSRSDIARELGDRLVEVATHYPRTSVSRPRPGPGSARESGFPTGMCRWSGARPPAPPAPGAMRRTLARDRNGHWTYQFAVVVGRHPAPITHVIRGARPARVNRRQVAGAPARPRACRRSSCIIRSFEGGWCEAQQAGRIPLAGRDAWRGMTVEEVKLAGTAQLLVAGNVPLTASARPAHAHCSPYSVSYLNFRCTELFARNRGSPRRESAR